MNFQFTTGSLHQTVQEMQIHNEHELAQLLIDYEQQQESSDLPDRTLLYRAHELLRKKIMTGPLDQELVLLANNLYRDVGAWEEVISLLRRYLNQSLDTKTRAWAWWHVVDCLALYERNLEVVREQQALLQWARAHVPLQDCFFVLADSTQARCWLKSGYGNDWLYVYHEFASYAPSTGLNRLDRFYCLRTAVHQCLELGDLTYIDALLSNLDELEHEDSIWAERNWTTIEIAILNIAVIVKSGDTERVRMLALQAMKQQEEWERQLNKNVLEEVKRFRSLSHNLAAPLYRGGYYDLAIPLFEKAVKYHTNPYYAYLWLAASLWQTTHQRERVFPYLRQAAARYDGEGHVWEQFRKLPEFQDVENDQEFQAVVEAGAKEHIM